MESIAAPQTIREFASDTVPLWVSGVQDVIAGNGPSGLTEPIGSTSYFAAYMALRSRDVSVQEIDEESFGNIVAGCSSIVLKIDNFEKQSVGTANIEVAGIGDRLRGLLKIKGMFSELLEMVSSSEINWSELIKLVSEIAAVLKLFL